MRCGGRTSWCAISTRPRTPT
ncbi:MAG: hypothetical protein HY784_12895 [Chloroflexi bacterium]|nr:hypothetical protein [Chloroflexota bacterium]